MLYPEKINAKKGKLIIRWLILLSVVIAETLIIINKYLTPDVAWAGFTNAGIIYAWITVIYSINRNTNIAKHVLIQTILASCLTYYIDYRLRLFRLVA